MREHPWLISAFSAPKKYSGVGPAVAWSSIETKETPTADFTPILYFRRPENDS